jgi:hypothetical protein
MNISKVQPGDNVTCNVKGREFTATVEEKVDGGLRISPDSKGITYFHVTARQITKINKKAKE